MITSIILYIINSLWYGLLDFFFFKDIPFLPLDTFKSILTIGHDYLLPAMSWVNVFFPLQMLLGVALIYFIGHIFIFSFQGVKFFINLWKLSGKV